MLNRYIELVRERFINGPLDPAQHAEIVALSGDRAEARIDIQRSMQAQMGIIHQAEWPGLASHVAHMMLGYRIATRFGDDSKRAENPFKPDTVRFQSFEMGRAMFYRDSGTWMQPRVRVCPECGRHQCMAIRVEEDGCFVFRKHGDFGLCDRG